MHIEHVMTRDPVACDVQDAIGDVARLMGERNIGFVVVLDKGRVVGVVTDRQIAVRGLGEGLSPGSPVAGIMTRNPATLTLQDDIFSAVDTMRSAGVVRRLPVLDDAGRLVGVVSISDLAVIAKDLVEAVLAEDTRHALKEAHLATGGKRLQRVLERPLRERQGEDYRDAPAPGPVTTSSIPGPGPMAR